MDTMNEWSQEIDTMVKDLEKYASIIVDYRELVHWKDLVGIQELHDNLAALAEELDQRQEVFK